jgi:hypothetical protein
MTNHPLSWYRVPLSTMDHIDPGIAPGRVKSNGMNL